MMPPSLLAALAPVTVIAGHYGVGKTNFACNLAIGLAADGRAVTLADLDIVNPYFRASEQRSRLEAAGVQVIAPVFAEVGSSLDVPSLRGSIAPALQRAGKGCPVLVDAGGDDAGAVALGRFSAAIAAGPYAMLGVLNALRNEVRSPREARENLRAIEDACHLRFTALVDNTHLKGETTAAVVEEGYAYSCELARLTGLPLAAVTLPEAMAPEAVPSIPAELLYPVATHVKNPWE